MSVGTNMGDIALWEVGSRERVVSKIFKVWDVGACSMPLQVHFFASLVLYSRMALMNITCNASITDAKIDHDQLQASLVKDPSISVNRVIWSPDGSLFGKSQAF